MKPKNAESMAELGAAAAAGAEPEEIETPDVEDVEDEPEEEEESPLPADREEEELSEEDFIKGLLSDDFDDDPELGASHKGLPSWEELLESSTPEQRKALGNARSAITRAQQEAAEARRETQALREQVAQQQQALLSSPALQQQEDAKPPDFDLLTVEGLQAFTMWHAQQAAQKAARELLQQAYEPVQKQVQQHKVQTEYLEVKARYPQLQDTEFQKEVRDVLKESEHLSLESAVKIAIGNRALKRDSEAAENRRQRKKETRRRRSGDGNESLVEMLGGSNSSLRDQLEKDKSDAGIQNIWND